MPEEKKKPSEEKKETPKADARGRGKPRRDKRSGPPGNKKDFEKTFDKEAWKPKTAIGKKVKSGEIKQIDEILDNGYNILEAEIVDVLLPGLSTELLLVGQSKGKFGGGSRRIFRQTQKKTREGNKPKFSTVAVMGNEDGYVGLGYGKSKETVPAREKAMRNAKLNMIKIRRGCGSWQCGCKESHTIPFTVEGKCGSVILKLIPAPKGTGLKVESECGKILKLAGINDVWSKTLGHTSTKMNLIEACMDALNNLVNMKIKPQDITNIGIIDGSIKKGKTEDMKEFAEGMKHEEDAEEVDASKAAVPQEKPEKKKKKAKE
jgi:small subunit ribosomal protein S5